MKTNFKIFIVAIAAIITISSLALASCEKEKSSVYIAKGGNELLNLKNTERQYFAELLATRLYENMQVFNELNEAIHLINTEYGMDENLTFYDIMNTDKSVFLTSSSCVEMLRTAFNDSDVLNEFNLTEDNFYMNLQFYWPYHDEWDKSCIPTICFAPTDNLADTTMGFCYKEGALFSVPVYKRDIDEGDHSLIIINQGEVLYENYPNFKDGVWEKNGCTWVKPKWLQFLTESKAIDDNSTTNNKVYEAKSLSLQSSGTQYDSWGGGANSIYRLHMQQMTIQL